MEPAGLDSTSSPPAGWTLARRDRRSQGAPRALTPLLRSLQPPCFLFLKLLSGSLQQFPFRPLPWALGGVSGPAPSCTSPARPGS